MHATERGGNILSCVAVAAALNFFLFVGISLASGGSADGKGPTEGGYYVSDHGRRTEVTAAHWYFSRVHAVLAFCGVLSVFGTMVWLLVIGELHWYDDPDVPPERPNPGIAPEPTSGEPGA